MAKAKKQSRNIVVDDTAFRWRATGDDGCIAVTIWPVESDGAIITAHVPYQETWKPNGNGGWSSLGDQIIVTNRLIRRMIELAKSDYQYEPSIKGKPVSLRGDAIELSDAVRAVYRSADR